MATRKAEQSGVDAGQVLIYHTGEDGARIDVRLAGEMVWLT